jgi:hypothetical protein
MYLKSESSDAEKCDIGEDWNGQIQGLQAVIVLQNKLNHSSILTVLCHLYSTQHHIQMEHLFSRMQITS